MKLTIIAATGGVGRQLLRQAPDAGHDVTAVARNPANLPQDVLAGRAVRIVAADLAAPDPQVLQDAVAGADAVLSALGPHNDADAGIAAPGTRAITDAMRAAGVRRIVAISASPVATTPSPGRPNPPRHDPGDGFLMRQVGERIAKALFGKVYDDLARMEDILRDSGLDWTVLRPPQLTGKPLTGRYRTAYERNVRGGRSVPRRRRSFHARRAGPARHHRPGYRYRDVGPARVQLLLTRVHVGEPKSASSASSASGSWAPGGCSRC